MIVIMRLRYRNVPIEIELEQPLDFNKSGDIINPEHLVNAFESIKKIVDRVLKK